MLYPLNRYLVVSLESKKTSDSTSQVWMPENIEVDENPFCVVTLKEPHVDSRLKQGMRLLVPKHCVEKASVDEGEYYLLLENHVIGFIEEDAK